MEREVSALNAMPSSVLSGHARTMFVMRWGERFEEVLQETGISQAAIARACNISRSAVNQWLDQSDPPKVDNLIAVADLTGYSIRWLASGKGAKRLTDKAEITKMRELWDKYTAAPETARKAIDALLDFRIDFGNQSADDKKKNTKR